MMWHDDDYRTPRPRATTCSRRLSRTIHRVTHTELLKDLHFLVHRCPSLYSVAMKVPSNQHAAERTRPLVHCRLSHNHTSVLVIIAIVWIYGASANIDIVNHHGFLTATTTAGSQVGAQETAKVGVAEGQDKINTTTDSDIITEWHPNDGEVPFLLHAAPQLVHNNATNDRTTLRIASYNPKDRMGSKLQNAIGGWALSRALGWKFCSPNDEAITLFPDIDICNENQTGTLVQKLRPREMSVGGVYSINSRGVHKVWSRIQMLEQRQGEGRVWGSTARAEWRDMILNAAPKERLFTPKTNGNTTTATTIKIVVHIRRGDVAPTGKWAYRFIDDNAYLQLIALCKEHLQNQPWEVHIFSEDYGATNWTAFENPNTYFHLAPRDTSGVFAPGNLTENVRDWAHFLEADILIAGGTFSVIPALARPAPSPESGLPLTIYYGRNYGYLSGGWYPKYWLPWEWNGTEVTVNFSKHTSTASRPNAKSAVLNQCLIKANEMHIRPFSKQWDEAGLPLFGSIVRAPDRSPNRTLMWYASFSLKTLKYKTPYAQRRAAMVNRWMKTRWFCDDTVGKLVGKPKMRDMIVIECPNSDAVNEIRVHNMSYFVGAHAKCELESPLEKPTGNITGGAYLFGSQAKNLTRLLPWMEYHRLLGVDHFYLYLIGDFTDEEALALPALAFVTYVPFLVIDPSDVVDTGIGSRVFGYQVVQIHDLLYRARAAGFEWLFFNDVDEYLQVMGGPAQGIGAGNASTGTSSVDTEPAQAQLSSYFSQDTAYFEVYTWFFGNAQSEDQPGFVRDPAAAYDIDFVYRDPEPVRGRRQKCIIRPDRIHLYDVHTVISGDKGSLLDPYKQLRFNHYKDPTSGVFDLRGAGSGILDTSLRDSFRDAVSEHVLRSTDR